MADGGGGPDGSIPLPDGSIPWPDGTGFGVIMNLMPPIPADPVFATIQLSFTNPGAVPEVITPVSTSIRFVDGQVTTFPVNPTSFTAQPGMSFGSFLKTGGSGTAIMFPATLCGTTADLTMDLSTGQTITGVSTQILCVM